MAIQDYWEKTKKIRTVSLDTNVILDVLDLKLYESENKLNLFPSNLVERLESSFQILALLFSVNVKILGAKIVKKELNYSSATRLFYEKIFDDDIKHSVQIRRLAENYKNKLGIGYADAFVLASISVGRIDCFFSWNRHDIVSEVKLKAISEINHGKNIPMPIIIQPCDFLERVILSDSMPFSLCFSREAIRRVYLPKFSPSKQFL